MADIVQDLINHFSESNLLNFMRKKIPSFKLDKEDYEYLFEDDEKIRRKYTEIRKLGEAALSGSDDLIVICAHVSEPLSERSGKKRQFEIAKKILKQETKDAAFFIFYDD